jgi:chromosome segregation protein
MKLKKLQMQGFKSFADRTEIQFNQNIVAVVGPNGCGKSNIVDAIRWTMGEQSAKGLRGKEMSDVIFAGTPSRKAANFAEASLVFENLDGSAPPPYGDVHEIMVTRRLFRTGESEYLINNVQMRLKDIQDLFLGTGSSAKAYSIVAQGKVDHIVLAKPEERRFLLEEAAGVAKYKVRKQAAERKMESTHQNLARVQDILVELERSAKSLERQVEKAEKFRAIQRELRELDERVVSAKIKKLDHKALENHSNIDRAKENFETQLASLNSLESKLEEKKFQVLNEEKISSSEIEKLFRKKEDFSQAQMEFELGVQKMGLLGNQIEERKKDIDRLQGKSRDQAEHQVQLQKELEDLEKERQIKAQKNQELKESLAAAELKRIDIDLRLKESLKELDQIKTQATRENQRREMQQAERIEFELQRAEVEQKIENLEKEKTLKMAELEFFNRSVAAFLEDERGLELKIRDQRQFLDELASQKEDLLRKTSDTEIQIADFEAQLTGLKTLEDHHVGYEPGALEIKEKTNSSLLFEQIQFKPEFRALGEILMSHLGQAVMTNEGLSERIITRWHQLVLLKSTASIQEENCSIFIEQATSEDIRAVLAAIRLVNELDPNWRGAQLSRSGEFQLSISDGLVLKSQGDLKRDQNPFSRRQEQKELQTSLEDCRRTLAAFAEDRQRLEKESASFKLEIQNSENQLKSLRYDLDGLRHKCLERQQSMARQEAVLEQYRMDLSAFDLRIAKIEEQLALQIQTQDLHRLTLEVQEAENRLDLANKEKTELETHWVEFRIAFGALNERVERLRQQQVSSQMTQSEYTHNQEVFESDIRIWKTEMNQIDERSLKLKQLIQELKSEVELHEKNLAMSKESLRTLQREQEELEQDRKSLQTEKDKCQTVLQDLEMERRELRHQVEELGQILQERYQMTIQDLIAAQTGQLEDEFQSDEELEKAVETSHLLRDRLMKFGDVNLVALQEYEEIKKRLDFMSAQKEDLLKTLDSLQSIIQRINKITEFRFRETFKAINHNFQILFPKLFGGGKAFMKLTDEVNLLETGVEIFAEPPGKKIQAMSLLSGGEKAMTSISLIFSLFAYRPSSFCILDEVDAPLDDINTRRYNEIIQEMAALSQFIVITHNKRTMEVASTLFGVTMQDPGCSRVVGVDLREARSFTGDVA